MPEASRVVVFVAVLAHASAGHADDVDALVDRGNAFAKQGEWTRAIQAFKEADAITRRASHACLIGLAYTRRELWAQAELFFARCRARANADDPLPGWLAAAEHTLQDKLARANAAAITVTVDPPEQLALISVSSFAPDETFSPRTFHLAPGTYTIAASAPGFRPASETITIDDAAPRTVKLALAPSNPQAAPAAPVQPGPEAPSRSRVPTIMMITGGVLLAGGLGVHLGLTTPERNQLDTDLNSVYEQHHDAFLHYRRWTIGLYATGAIVGITGMVWRLGQRSRGDAAHVAVIPTAGGAFVSAEWRR